MKRPRIPAVYMCGGAWRVAKAIVSRSARRLMEGWVRVPPARDICGDVPHPGRARL